MTTADIDMHSVLHDGRSGCLRGIDATGKTMVSVGASGRWYFDWIHSSCGYPARHIGVELFVPKPDGLPENTEWVANTAGDMSDIESDVADIVFSGQNIEHLWEEDVGNFLLESNRVLKTGGLLVIDSPNRVITAALNIIHPEHMVELTPDEMCDLMVASGFEVTAKRGIYLTRDQSSGQILPYEPESCWGTAWSLIQRCTGADRNPGDSYLWWIEARKTGTPDEPRIRQIVRQAWAQGWPERMRRLRSEIGTITMRADKCYYDAAPGIPGCLIYGPYAPLTAGRYRVVLMLASTSPIEVEKGIRKRLSGALTSLLTSPADREKSLGHLEIVISEEIVARVEIFGRQLAPNKYRPVAIEFVNDLPTAFGFQARIISNGYAGLSVEREVRIDRVD